MAVTEMELNEALSRAAALMSPEGQRKIDMAKKMNNGNFDDDGGFVQPSNSYGMRSNTVNVNKPLKNNSGLPKVIQESILNNPLDDNSEYSLSSSSVLDNFVDIPKSKPVKESYVHEQQYTAQPQTPQYWQPQYSQPQMMGGVDYNYIRMIVNECIQTNLKQIKEEILKESSLKTIRLGGENKIQLIDNKNNLYESKLEYKKNISKK